MEKKFGVRTAKTGRAAASGAAATARAKARRDRIGASKADATAIMSTIMRKRNMAVEEWRSVGASERGQNPHLP